MIRSAVLIAFCSVASVAAAAPPEVHVEVTAADNLADTAEPIPTIGVFNDSKDTIEFQIFHGVPFTITEQRAASGDFPRPSDALCGNGFLPHQLAPGQSQFFPLWARVDHGPGLSGTYRIVLPYIAVHGKRRTASEATSGAFALAYGDIAPRDAMTKPGSVVIVSAERERNSPLAPPTPAALAAKLLPEISACVATAQKRLPWLRGRFTLEVYQYGNPAPTLFVDTSLLGDKDVNACLGAIQVHDRIPTKVELTFAVSPPTS